MCCTHPAHRGVRFWLDKEPPTLHDYLSPIGANLIMWLSYLFWLGERSCKALFQALDDAYYIFHSIFIRLCPWLVRVKQVCQILKSPERVGYVSGKVIWAYGNVIKLSWFIEHFWLYDVNLIIWKLILQLEPLCSSF